MCFCTLYLKSGKGEVSSWSCERVHAHMSSIKACMFYKDKDVLEPQWWAFGWLLETLQYHGRAYIMHQEADALPQLLIKTLIKWQRWQPLMTEAWTRLLISHSTSHSSASAGCQPCSQTWEDLLNRICCAKSHVTVLGVGGWKQPACKITREAN